MQLKKGWILFLLKFSVLFCFFYFGTKAMIGLQAPGGGYYSPFLEKYFNYIDGLRSFVAYSTRLVMQLMGYVVAQPSAYQVRLTGHNGIYIGFGCLGYGTMSCWIAFIIANHGKAKFKIYWVLMGLFLIQLCNVVRMTLILVAGYYHWPTFKRMDHHDFFNYLSYIVILLLIHFFQKQLYKIEDQQALFQKQKINEGGASTQTFTN